MVASRTPTAEATRVAAEADADADASVPVPGLDAATAGRASSAVSGATDAGLDAALLASIADLGPAPRLVLAVSGGADSTALMLVAATTLAASQLVVAHVNHRMQAGADDWEDRVAAQAASLGLPFRVERLDGAAAAARRHDGLGAEGWARGARYRALAAIAAEQDAVAVLTAHHRADQIETHLLQRARGAGDRGLAAMPARRPLIRGQNGAPWLLRPFLAFPRSRLARVVAQRGWLPVDDPSNRDSSQARSALRLALGRLGSGATDGGGTVGDTAMPPDQRTFESAQGTADPGPADPEAAEPDRREASQIQANRLQPDLIEPDSIESARIGSALNESALDGSVLDGSVLDGSVLDGSARAGSSRIEREAFERVLIERIEIHRIEADRARRLADSDLASVVALARPGMLRPGGPTAAGPPMLDRRRVSLLSTARRAELWRYWLETAGLGAPSRRRLGEIDRQLTGGAAEGRIRHDGVWILRYRDRIGLLERLPLPCALHWISRDDAPDPAAAGARVAPGSGGGSNTGGGSNSGGESGPGGNRRVWTVRLPVGDEAGFWFGPGRAEDRWRSVPGPGEGPRHRPSRSLRKLWQEAGVPTWLRPALPTLRTEAGLVVAAMPFGLVEGPRPTESAPGRAAPVAEIQAPGRAAPDAEIQAPGRCWRWAPDPRWLPWLAPGSDGLPPPSGFADAGGRPSRDDGQPADRGPSASSI